MKRIMLALVCLSLAACGGQTGALEPEWSTPNTLKTPESIKYDPERGHIYVSNINGNPTAEDNNGFISRLSPDGEIIDLKWIEGLSAPKGMAIVGNRLYVTDIYQLAEIDLDRGEITGRYDAEGSEFLNDVAADDSGSVYVSDMSADIIYKLEEGVMKIWLREDWLERPNGLTFGDGKLYIGGAGFIRAVDISTGTSVETIDIGFSIDGLVHDGEGGFIASDWQGKTVRIGREGNQQVILDTSREGINSADIEYIAEKSLLIIPTFGDNRAVAYKLGNK